MMNKILMSIMILALGVSVPASAATVAHWNFEDGMPGVSLASLGGAADFSGNGYQMYGFDDYWGSWFSELGDTPTGIGMSSTHIGNHQDGYTLDPVINAWSPETWTIEVSVLLDDLSGWLTMIGRDGSSQGEPESDFYLQCNGINDRFRINFDTVGGTRYILDSDFIPQAGQWYHLAVVSDGTNVTMYADQLDGAGYQSVGTLAMTGATTADNALAATDYNWTFGRGWYSGGYVDHIEGNLDDIRFSDVALSTDQLGDFFPLSAREPNPQPLNENGTVGTMVGDKAELTLKCLAGLDPLKVDEFNPEILTHYIWISKNRYISSDPNFYYLGQTLQTSPTDANVSYGPIQLDESGLYKWSVEEGLDSGMGPYPPGDEWNIDGPIWIFKTAVGSVDITSEPVSTTANPDASFTVVSPNADTYQWYKEGNPPDALSDGSIYSGTQTDTLTLTAPTINEEGKYYCYLANSMPSDANSASAQLWIARLVGHWKFEENLNDERVDWPGEYMDPNRGITDTPVYYTPPDDANAVDGKAITFNNDSYHVVVLNSGEYFNFYPYGFTYNLWYRAAGEPVGWRLPICKLDATADVPEFYDVAAGWLFGIDHATRNEVVFIEEDSGTWVNGNADIDTGDGQWHMLTTTYNPDDTTVRVYTDGELDTETVLDLSNTPVPTEELSIGGRIREYSISGMIDEVQVYSYALDSHEVAALYVQWRDAVICVENPEFDVSGPEGTPDCIVDLFDFAELAKAWLSCGAYPDCD